MLSQFASSSARLAGYFQKSRDAWKARSHEYQKRIRHLEGKVRDLQRSREKWKAEAMKFRDQPTSNDNVVADQDVNMDRGTSAIVPTESSQSTAIAAPPFCPHRHDKVFP